MTEVFDLDAMLDEDRPADEEPQETSYKEQTVVLIDAQPAMFEACQFPSQDFQGLSWMGAAMKTVGTIIRHRAMGGGGDQVAVVLFNTRTSKSKSNIEHTYVLQDLAEPDVERILEVDRYTDEDFQRGIGAGSVAQHDRTVALANALWEAKVMFGQNRKTSKTIMLCTVDPTPSSAVEGPLQTYASDLAELDVFVQLFPLAASITSFNLDLFWNMLLDMTTPAPEEAPQGQVVSTSKEEYNFAEERVLVMTDLLSIVRRKAYKKRTLSRLTWSIAPGLNIGVRLYAVYRPAKDPPKSYVHAQTHELLKSSTANIELATGAVVKEVPTRYFPKEDKEKERGVTRDIHQSFPKIRIDAEELRGLKAPLAKGIRLLGFKPLSALKHYHSLGTTDFIYLDEKSIGGSTVLFTGLHKVLLEEDKVAICSFVRGPRAEPIIVAAVPQVEEKDESGQQYQGPGFHLLRVPFMDDLRSPESDTKFTGPAVEVTEDQVNAAGALVDALELEEFGVGQIANPRLQRHYLALECLAVGTEVPDEIVDETEPDADAFENAAQIINNFKVKCGLNQAAPKKASGGKRTMDAVETAELAAEVEAMGFEVLEANNKLAELSNDNLKKYLKLHKLKQSGKKAELVERISAHIRNVSGKSVKF